MIKRTSLTVILALCAGIPFAVRAACEQDSAEKNPTEQNTNSKGPSEKNAKEQSAAEKGKAESTLGDNTVNFPLAMGPVELRPARGAHITLKLTDASRAIYEAIGKQAKITVLFDPDYIPRNISVDMNDVSLQDALKIVNFESRAFWRPVTSDVIIVAQDTPAKRREFEQQIIKTFYFPNISSPTDLQDIVNSMRTLLEVQRVQQIPSHQSILLRGTPEQMVVAERLMDDLHRAKEKTGGEYRVEYKITETTEEKKAIPRTYTLLIEPQQTGRLRIGSKVPIDVGDNKKSYMDVGKNIDCTVLAETERTVSLRTTVESSEIATDGHGGAESAHGNPVVQGTRIETNVILELGTPTTIGHFQDPVSMHGFQIEVTATRSKSKE